LIIELRKKSQIAIPKEIISSLGLVEGDHLEVSIKDGQIVLEPVAIYSKEYVEKLERLTEKANKDSSGPFSSVEDIKKHLENDKGN
jgi:AbrB family looped-hinge helix DNA binding protein